MPHVSQAFTPVRLCRFRRLRPADGRCAYPCHRESWLALHDANTSRGGTPLPLGDPARAAGWTAVTRFQTGDLLVLICCLFFSVICSLQVRCRYDARPTLVRSASRIAELPEPLGLAGRDLAQIQLV